MSKNIYDFLSKATSIVVHPLVLPTYFYLIIYYASPQIFAPLVGEVLYWFLILSFVCTFLLPALTILILYFTHKITVLEISDRSERILVLIYTIFIYTIWLYVMYYKFFVNNFLTITYISMLACMTISGIITHFWKISLHSTAISGMVVMLGYIVFFLDEKQVLIYFVVSILAWGAVCSARLQLHKHTLWQVLAGTFLGIVCAIGGMWVAKFV
ncbi:MAG: hypothetical protein NW207_05700 [Cytophagales bacterium]|nr:hypothetical protein [Cytophagales bacterium]